MILLHTNSKDTDTPTHSRRLISALDIRFLVGIIAELAIGNVSIFKLVSVAEWAGFNPDKPLPA